MACEPKLGLSFHRTFALRRAGVSQILRLAVDRSCLDDTSEGRTIGASDRDETSLGTVDYLACRRYAYGLGLVDKSYSPTAWGRCACKYDPILNDTKTQWIMHYHMVSPHHCGPTFWAFLVVNWFRPGCTLLPDEMLEALSQHLQHQDDRDANKKTLRKAITAFLGTYAEPDGLRNLLILQRPKVKDDGYIVCEPEPPDWRVVAYVLADYWKGAWGEQLSVGLDDLKAPGGLSSLLMMGSGQLNGALREMQQRGLLELKRKVPPYTVFRLWQDSNALLEAIYE